MVRNNGEKALELEARRVIFEIVSRFPGLHFRELLRRLNIPHSSVSYHLRYLIKEGLVTEVVDGGHKRYYVHGEVDHTEKEILSVLRKEIPRGIVLFLLLNPEAGYQDILDNFDLSPSQLSYYLDKLLKKDILEQVREGRNTFYSVKDEERVANVLISYKPSFLDSVVDAFVDIWLSRHSDSD